MAQNQSLSRRHQMAWRRPFFIFGAVLLSAGILFACGTVRFDAIRPGLEQRGHYIENVPFFRQSESTCGPAALATVLAFWGRPADLEEITEKIYVPKLRGTLPMDLEGYARGAGLKTTSFAGTLAELKAYIRKGEPVICMLDLGFSIYHRPHYITAIGFDDINRVIIEHDGLQPNSLISYDKFNSAWERADRWMIVITP
jgi:ABC-type bacteriocin/lantibiotic exporter with double-glycine peptidase domain